jgi:hypothetical protein
MYDSDTVLCSVTAQLYLSTRIIRGVVWSVSLLLVNLKRGASPRDAFFIGDDDMKIYTKKEFKIFIVGNYISNYDGFDDTVFDHSSYYGVYDVKPSILKIIEEKSPVEMRTYHDEIQSNNFIDIHIASHRIHYLNHECNIDNLKDKGYRIIGDRYFVPKFANRYDYFVNRMVDTIDTLKSRWKYEFQPLLKKIKTPEEVRQDVFVSRVAYGVEEYEESQSAGFIAMMKRSRVYDYIINSYYAQFIHLVGSVVEDSFIRGLLEKGNDISNFDRNVVYNLVFNKTGRKYEDIPNANQYTNFIVLWNFLKHNNKVAYDEVKKQCPQYLIENRDFLEYGHSSQNYLKISSELIDELLVGLKNFFISFSEFVFSEDYSEACWNYFDYFVEEAYFTYKWNLMPT